MNNSGIYTITNLIDGKVYVGSAVNLSARRRQHFSDLKLQNHRNDYLQKAWNKHGSQSFVFRPVLYCDKEWLIMWEQVAIDGLIATTGRCRLYNLCLKAGSSLGAKISMPDSMREKTRARMLGRKLTLGMKFGPETSAKLSALHKGKPLSPEHRAKIAVARVGKSMSLEARQKMSASQKRRFTTSSPWNKGKKKIWHTGQQGYLFGETK